MRFGPWWVLERKLLLLLEECEKFDIDGSTRYTHSESGVYFEGFGGLESPENESVGHSQTRPESGRISGMKLTQASPQIYRQNLLAKNKNKFTAKTTDF